MKKNLLKIVTLLVSCMVIMGSFSAFAANETNQNNKENRQKLEKENMVLGKITQIDANNVVISVATRKERQKKDKNSNNSNLPKINQPVDEKYTLTGETKTINIQNADFGRIFAKNNDNANADTTSNTKKTYLDYKVGDYVRITMSDNTSNVAKRIREADFGSRGGKGNYKGNYQGSYKKNKDNNGQQ